MATKAAVNRLNGVHTAEVVTPIVISKPKAATLSLKIKGTAPYVQARFSQKALIQIEEKQKAGTQGNNKKARKPRDFDADYEAAKHIASEGWCGIPAAAFRNAMISACRLVGFKMTIAKMSVFVVADGYDKVDGVPLVKIEGKPQKLMMHARNATGVCDLRARPQWREWSAVVRVRYDEEQFSATDVVNLMARVGMQVGIGEGRPDSRESNGLGWGTFEIVS